MSGSSSKGSSRPGKLAQHIEQLIDRSPKTQREIAREAGYENPNIITMLKQGHTRVPLDKVGPLAKALDADPVQLLRLVGVKPTFVLPGAISVTLNSNPQEIFPPDPLPERYEFFH